MKRTTDSIRKTATEFGIPSITLSGYITKETTHPMSWDVNKRAAYDWYHAFMGRHPGLSLRTPESTSLGRASAFNKAKVSVHSSS